MSTVRRSYAARFVVALMVVGVSTACVSIPESSSVHAGRGPSAQDERPLSSNTPNGPRPGAGRKEIATGYLSAMLAFPPAPDVVREFLTPEAATAWNPEQGLVVYTESSRPRLSETANFVIFSARALGSLDERGSWSTATGPRREIRAAFAMERVGGEWRLRNPLPGTYVDQDYFSTYYDAFSLYFFEATNTILAADPVHMLLGDSLATSLVEDLLKGPTRELQGAVGSSMPTTATVTTAVSISPSGVAEIPLSDEILQLSANDRRLFAAQLVWTLQPLQEINTIVVTVDGARVDLGVGTEVSTSTDFAGFDPAVLAASRQLYALTSQGLVTVSDKDTTRLLGPVSTPSREARSVAVDPNAAQAALVSGDGSTVTVAGLTATDTGTTVWYSGGDDVVPPSWDIHKVLWLADNRSDGAHLLVGTGPTMREVDAPGISGRLVSSIAVSRDGIRLAAIVGRGSNRHLVISVIERDAHDVDRVTLRRAKPVITAGLAGTSASSAHWISPTSIAALTDDQGAQPQPTELSIDGALPAPFPGFLPIRPITLAAAPNADTPTAIGDAQGRLYIQTPDSGWGQIGGTATIRAPVYAG